MGCRVSGRVSSRGFTIFCSRAFQKKETQQDTTEGPLATAGQRWTCSRWENSGCTRLKQSSVSCVGWWKWLRMMPDSFFVGTVQEHLTELLPQHRAWRWQKAEERRRDGCEDGCTSTFSCNSKDVPCNEKARTSVILWVRKGELASLRCSLSRAL